MDEDDSLNFCTHCGAPLRDSDVYCPSCGSDPRRSQSAPTYNGGYSGEKSNRLMTASILCALWALSALGIGLYSLLGAESLIETMMSDPAIWDQISPLYSKEELESGFFLVGVTFTASGALAAISSLLCVTKRFYIIALVACIISSAFALVALIGVIGFLVAYLIYRGKNEFKDQKPNTI